MKRPMSTRKKMLSVCFCLLALGPGASALELGMGWGARIDISPVEIATLSSIASCVYFDATYLQSSLGYRLQHLVDLDVDAASELYGLHERAYAIPVQDLAWLDIVILAKYPFTFGRFSVYPQVGIEYAPNLAYVDENGDDIKVLSYEDETGKEKEDALSVEELRRLNLFYLEAGVGMDFTVTVDPHTNTAWYFRIETLFKYNPFLGNYAISANLLYGCVFPRNNQDQP